MTLLSLKEYMDYFGINPEDSKTDSGRFGRTRFVRCTGRRLVSEAKKCTAYITKRVVTGQLLCYNTKDRFKKTKLMSRGKNRIRRH